MSGARLFQLQSYLAGPEGHGGAEAERPALVHPGAADPLTRAQVAERACAWAEQLQGMELPPGSAIAVASTKSVHAVVAILGVLEAGHAYVPIDSTVPIARQAALVQDTRANAAIGEAAWLAQLGEQLGGAGGQAAVPGAVAPLELLPLAGGQPHAALAPELAYILGTSGSTGRPKGVAVSHAAADHFVRWAIGATGLGPDDRVASVAPLHFDLSIFDLFASQRVGAALVLVDATTQRRPAAIVELLQAEAITTLYTTPTLLALLMEYGQPERFEWPALRRILFAGEVLPMETFHRLRERWPDADYCNFYGPTETNVCTWFRVPPGPVTRREPWPIGQPCGGMRARVVDEAGSDAPEGELWMAGPTVMAGYCAPDGLNRDVFEADAQGTRWYRTGDRVRRADDGTLSYVGRLDRMVKRRGYRIELGEIEAALGAHPQVHGVAALLAPGDTPQIVAVLACQEPPSTVEMKRFSNRALPAYMIPDRFVFVDRLPMGSTGKVDLRALGELI